MSWADNNTAIHTLADGTRVDTENLPEGQRICTHCMHLHPVQDIYFGPLSRHPVTGHWARRKRMVKVGELAVPTGRYETDENGDQVEIIDRYSMHEERGEIACVGCKAHGPHPEMP